MIKKKQIRKKAKPARAQKTRGKTKPTRGSSLPKRKTATKKVQGKKKGRAIKGNLAYCVNTSFSFYKELHALLAKTSPEAFPFIESHIKKLGHIKMLIVTGVFLNIKDTRVDMLVVGEGIDISKFTNLIQELEAEMGKEIRYVILSEEEFIYRYEMSDRFLGDILDYPHQKIINKIRL